jgi:alpha-1,6-mannosyltransferase
VTTVGRGAVIRGTGMTGDTRVFAGCLAGLLAGLAFLVVPLAPKLLPLHHLPTNHDFDVELKPQGLVTPFWVVSMGSFALAVWQWRRGRRLELRWLVAGALLLNLVALLVPPVASKDVYAYSFYGKVQVAYHANPYLSIPDQYPLDPWHPFWSWRLFGPVYGAPFLLLLKLVAWVSGPSLLAWVLWMKLLLTAAELGAVALLDRVLRGGAAAQEPGWPWLLIAWNPMVLQSVAMSAHVDALLLLLLAAALLAHRRGRHLLAFVLLVVLFCIKVYMGPLAALYAVWLAAGKRPAAWAWTVGRLGALGVAITALAYLPYASAGTRLFSSVVDVSDHFSSGSPPNLLRRLLAAGLPLLGVNRYTAGSAGDTVARELALAAITLALLVAATRLRRDRDPWPLLAAFFLTYLLCTPWVFYWHEIPLLGMVAVIPFGLTSLTAVALSITLTPQVPASAPATGGSLPSAARELANTLTAFLSRYGGAVAALLLGWRRRARPHTAGPGTGAGADSEAIRGLGTIAQAR